MSRPHLPDVDTGEEPVFEHESLDHGDAGFLGRGVRGEREWRKVLGDELFASFHGRVRLRETGDEL